MTRRILSLGLVLALMTSSASAATTKFIESGTDATQDASFYSSTSGSVASDNSQSVTGPRSLKIDTGAGPTTAFANRTGVLADSGRRISLSFRFNTLPAANAAFVAINKSDTSTTIFGLNLTTGGLLLTTTGGGPTVTGSTVLSVNTWYRITLSYYVTNTTTFSCKVYVNGVLETTLNSGTLVNTASDTLQLRSSSLQGANRIHWYDNIYVDDGADSSTQTDTGTILVTAKRPNANGTATGFSTQIGAGGSGYGTGHSPQVNEQPLSQTNGWSSVSSAQTEEYNVEGAATGDVDISAGITLVDWGAWVFAKSGSNETGSIVVGGATSNIALTNTATLFHAYAASATYPAATGTDVGIVSDATATTVSLYEAGVLVAYTVNPASTCRARALLGVGC